MSAPPNARDARALRAAPARRALGGKLATVHELFGLLIEHGLWWLVPLVGVLLLTSVALAVLHAAQYVAPFVYSIF